MKKIPKISNSEWEVLKVLWDHQPCGSGEIVERLSATTDWKPNTIKTLLARLVKKGAVTATGTGRDYTYSAAIEESQCVRAESKSFLRRVYDGSTLPMLMNFLEDEKLSRDEIANIRKLLDEMERKLK